MTGGRSGRRCKGVEPGGGQKYDGEHGEGTDAEAVAERPAGNGAERGERDQDARPNPGAGCYADSDRMGQQRRRVDDPEKREQRRARASSK